ncbi:MAG TPA: 2-oxoglutarate dehydrogenase, E2 component, dihydrolipoamide succinyltransferase [Gemmatimonadales bacterium]|nr:2-oxoglutarate dehydrogenase, E2 component, dihydrolipoamide succinyltransferase [Gemmatimonadales bacterium]
MSRVDVVMPQMGESIAEGTLAKWLKKVGDAVKRDEPIFEISTDKVDAEIPAPSGGVLAEIKVPEGQTVPIQTVVAIIETEAGVGVSGLGVGAAPAPASAVAPVPSPSPKPQSPTPAAVAAPITAAPIPPTPKPQSPTPGSVESADERLRRRSTPLVRKIAADQGVDISTIPGTGHAGRVTKKDILGYIEASPAAAGAAAAVPTPKPQAPAPGAAGPWEASPWPGDRVEAMSRIRQLTAEHMVFSRRTSAHVTTFYEVDMTRVARLRAANKKGYEDRGVKLTYLGFIVKAVADQLRRHPVLNAAVQRMAVIYRGQVNIGIAVALDWGLIVPVIRGADELSLFGIAKAMADLADRARTKRLKPDEVQNGTFTITNPGVFGSYAGTPIINQPQVAILGVGAVERRPRVMTLDDGAEVVVPRTMTMLSISYDHRIVDGADADRFMSDLKKELEDFPETGV